MRRVRDDLEVVPAWAGAPLDPRGRELDPRGRERAGGLSRGQQADADALARDLEVLHVAVRLECGAELGVAHARDDEVVVLARIPSSSSRTAPPTT